MKRLVEYDWPGNVRELENILERAILLTDESVITSGNILPLLSDKKVKEEPLKEEPADVQSENTEAQDPVKKNSNLAYPKTLKEIEKNAIIEALIFTEWNMSKASKVLGVSRMTLYRKIEAYGIEEDE